MEGVLKKEEYQLYLDRLTQGYGRVLCSQEIMHAKEENIAYPVLRKRLKSICTSSRIKETLKTYPWHRLPRKQAAFAFTGYEFADENGIGLGKVVRVPEKLTYKEALKNTTIFTTTGITAPLRLRR